MRNFFLGGSLIGHSFFFFFYPQMKEFTIRTCWTSLRTHGRCCCTAPKSHPAPGTCPASWCPGTRRCRLTCAATCTTNFPSTASSWSTRSRWSRTIAVRPSARCTTGRNLQVAATRKPWPPNIRCCRTTVMTNNPKPSRTKERRINRKNMPLLKIKNKFG